MNTHYMTLSNFAAAHKLKNAANMLEVSAIINDAWVDYFDIRHFGMLKIRMREENCLEYFEQIKTMRIKDAIAGKSSFYSYMMSFIPKRMHSSIMYKEMSSKFENSNCYK